MFSRIACILLALGLLGACKSTPLEVVYADLAGAGSDASAAGAGGSGAGAGGAGAGGTTGSSGAGSGGAPVDAGPCSMVGAGRYVLRSRANLRCLGQGAPTTVFGNPAFLLDFSTECRLPERSWLLSATPTPNVFSIQNLSSGFVLDVQMAGIREGTPVITFGETGFDNQRFEVRARDEFASELRPQHFPQSCVSASANGAVISPCAPTASQEWQFQRSDCL